MTFDPFYDQYQYYIVDLQSLGGQLQFVPWP